MILNPKFFSGNLDESSSYYLGLLLADGGFTKCSRNTISLKMIDQDIVIGFKEALKSNGKVTIIPPSIGQIDNRVISCKMKYMVTITHPQIIADLKSLGLSVDNRKFLLQDKRIKTNHYLRGYLDGDGCIYTRIPKGKNFKRIEVIYVGTLDMLNDLSLYFQETLGLSVQKIRKDNRTDKIFLLRLGKKSSLLLCEWLYGNATIYLSRKKDKYIEVLNHDKLRQLQANFLDCDKAKK